MATNKIEFETHGVKFTMTTSKEGTGDTMGRVVFVELKELHGFEAELRDTITLYKGIKAEEVRDAMVRRLSPLAEDKLLEASRAKRIMNTVVSELNNPTPEEELERPSSAPANKLEQEQAQDKKPKLSKHGHRPGDIRKPIVFQSHGLKIQISQLPHPRSTGERRLMAVVEDVTESGAIASETFKLGDKHTPHQFTDALQDLLDTQPGASMEPSAVIPLLSTVVAGLQKK
jgi:hypothetical protein